MTIRLLCFMTLFFTIVTSYAQDDDLPIISADNVQQLQSVYQIDYADFVADIDIGWFTANDSATEFVMFDNDSNLYRITNNGEIIETWSYIDDSDEQLFSVIDGVFVFNDFHVLHTVDGQFWINRTKFDGDGIPLALGNDVNSLYVEVQIDKELVVYQLDEALEIEKQFTIPSQPIIRVGRIQLPIIVLSEFDGTVDILDYDTVVGKFTVTDSPAVFGHINHNKTHFAWSDPNSTYLNLLNLQTGENKVISELNGAYAQYYLLSHDASLVIAINVDFVPNVVAWDTTTGQRYNLGAYRKCERIPDKVALSADGTTLIIGCDTGLDLWQILDDTID